MYAIKIGIAFIAIIALTSTSLRAEPSGCPSLKDVPEAELTETHRIANRVCAAAQSSPTEYSKVMIGLWSDDGVNQVHEPGLPGDGMIFPQDNVKTVEVRDAESYKLMPDFRLENVDGKVLGDSFWIFYNRVGTLANGKKINVPIAARLILRAGKIVDARLTIDLSTMTDYIAAQRELAAKSKLK